MKTSLAYTSDYSTLATQNFAGKTDECQTGRLCRITILVSFLKGSKLFAILCGGYGSPNLQNRLCELGTFSRICSYISNSLSFFISPN